MLTPPRSSVSALPSVSKENSKTQQLIFFLTTSIDPAPMLKKEAANRNSYPKSFLFDIASSNQINVSQIYTVINTFLLDRPKDSWTNSQISYKSDPKKDTVLHVCVRGGCHKKIIQNLTQYGADPNSENDLQETPMTLAAQTTVSLGVFKALLDANGTAPTILLQDLKSRAQVPQQRFCLETCFSYIPCLTLPSGQLNNQKLRNLDAKLKYVEEFSKEKQQKRDEVLNEFFLEDDQLAT